VVRHVVAQVLEVVRSRPLLQVAQVLTAPDHVAQFVLHTVQVSANESKIVVPVGQLATQVLVEKSNIKGELHSVHISIVCEHFNQFVEHAVHVSLTSTKKSAVHESKHVLPCSLTKVLALPLASNSAHELQNVEFVHVSHG
jgi:putative lipoic acid-binding regulatory protein